MTYACQRAAIKIMDWLHLAEKDLIGVPVQHMSGEAGTVKEIRLDDHHGLCFTFDDPLPDYGARKFYPVSMIRLKGERDECHEA